MQIISALRHFGYERPSLNNWTNAYWYSREVFIRWLSIQSPLVITVDDDAVKPKRKYEEKPGAILISDDSDKESTDSSESD